MKSLTSSQVQRIDRLAAEYYGIPVFLLMENAGRAVADAAGKILKGKKSVVVLTGSGNNGGDGVAAARTLHNRGVDIQVWWLKDPKLLKGSQALHYRMALRSGVRFASFEKISNRAARLKQAGVLIDALLGTGTRGDIRGLYRDAINAINTAHRPVVAIDIPSGLDADTGKSLGVVIKASVTVTLAAAKKGLLNPSARTVIGHLIIADIGIPRALLR